LNGLNTEVNEREVNFFICRKENTPLDRVSSFQKYAAIRELQVLLTLRAGRLRSEVPEQLSWAVEMLANALKLVLIG